MNVSIMDEFNQYWQAITHGSKGFSKIQLTETRRAFHAGVYTLLGILSQIGSNPDISEEQGAMILEVIRKQIEMFYNDVKNGKM